MKCVVLGASGFIGGHLCRRLKDDGHYVIGIDREFHNLLPAADIWSIFHWQDLRVMNGLAHLLDGADEVYQLAADMGGAELVFTGEHDGDIMRNNVLINATVLEACRLAKVGRVFFSSSACVYPSLDEIDRGDVAKATAWRE